MIAGEKSSPAVSAATLTLSSLSLATLVSSFGFRAVIELLVIVFLIGFAVAEYLIDRVSQRGERRFGRKSA
jgi:hypothetical protein